MNWGWGLATVIWIAFLMLGVAWRQPNGNGEMCGKM